MSLPLPPPALELDAATERAAVNLLRNLEWQADAFALLFVFADVGPGLQIANWLDDRLVLQGRGLQRREFDKPFIDDADAVLEQLIAHLDEVNRLPGALWLAMNRHPDDAQWNQARRRFVARLNERRFLLERDLQRPLVLVLPVTFRSVLQSMAPDIWHVRATSEELRAKRSQPVAGSTLKSPDPRLPVQPDLHHPLRAFAVWKRLRALDASFESLLSVARHATHELMAAGRPADARRAARETLDQGRTESVNNQTAPGMRNLSVALDLLGSVESSGGDILAAEGAYRESLALSRQLLERLGGTPEALRDLSVSLDNVGDVARAQGDWPQAEGAYRESLALRRQLLERLGGTPEALRDLAFSLQNLANLPQPDGAAAAEALQIREALVERFPDFQRYADALLALRGENQPPTPDTEP